MSLDRCVAATADELGLDRGEAREIADRIVAEKDRLAAAGTDLSRAEDELRAYAGREVERARIAAALRRKQAALNIIARDAFDKHIDAQVGRGVDLEEAILSYLYGGPFSRDSVSARRKALEGDWLKGLLAEATEKVPALDYHVNHPRESKGFFDNVVREMAELREGGAPGRTGDKEAKAFADILAKYREAARLEANRAGANIGKLEGSAGPQAHDEGRLLKAGVERWKAAILDGLDVARSFGEGTSLEDAGKILDEVYLNIVTGHDRAVSATQKGERLGPANLARSLEKHRVLHFRDADAWLRYSDQLGRGHVLPGILDELGTVARRVSLMQKLGPNPENMLGAVVESRARAERLNAAADPVKAQATIDKLKLGDSRIGVAYSVVSGNIDIPTNVSRARFAANVRAVISMAKLGGSLLSQFSDLATYGAALRSQGKGYFEAYTDGIRGLVTGGGEGAERRAAMLGVGFDSILGDINRRFSVEEGLPGRMAGATAAFYKLSGIRWWSDRLETAFANVTSAHMASHADEAFDELDPQFAYTLGLNGLTGERWNVARHAVEEQAGRRFLMPEKIGELPDEAFDGLVADRLAGVSADKREAERSRLIARERRNLELDVRAYIAEEMESGVIKADDRAKAFVTQGTNPGSGKGEVFRFLAQFKSFPVAYYQRSLRRQTRGFAGADPRLTGIKGFAEGARKNLPAIATLVAASWVYGYASQVAKDLTKNRTPKSVTNHPIATLGAALLQGGGLGLFGDFLFGQVDRFGGGPVTSLAGPAVGEADQIFTLGFKARNSLGRLIFSPDEKPGPDDLRVADVLKFGLDNTPFANLFYARPVAELAILSSLQEWASPGVYRRRAQAVEKQFGQEPLLAPLDPFGTRRLRP